MAWHQFSIISDEQSATDISDFFSELGAVSVTYMDAEDQPVYEPLPGETKIWRQTKIIALFELDATEPTTIKDQVLSQFKQLNTKNWHYELLQDQVWERAWMEHYHPMKFGERLWVCPTGQEKYETGSVCLTLDPGLAFGTGTHPTTALCLDWLANHDLQGKTIIDYGCGSGILAVAGILLGAKQAYAIDIDPQALTATQDNAAKNKVQEKICCYLPEQFEPLQADIVIANILAKPLIELSDSICTLLKTSGQLVLSGILNEQADEVAKVYSSCITLAPISQQQDWCRLNGRKH